jgi:cytoskeleton protein RodZ
MAVSNVAALLRLDKSVIEALEADDIEQLPSTTFVKGYLRSYGSLVGVDGELLVTEYDQIAGTPAAELAVTPLGEAPKRRLGRWIFVLLLLIATVALAWFWSKPSEQPVSTETLRSDPVSSPPNGAFPVVAPAPNLDEQTADEVIDELLRTSNDQLAVAELTQTPAATEAPATVEAEEAAVAEVAAVETSPVEPAPVVEAAPALMTIKLIGVDESWVSIRDARDQRVYRDLLKPGATHELSGRPPLLVHLGNANGVVIDVDGTTFIHKPWHKVDGTARFVLNPNP